MSKLGVNRKGQVTIFVVIAIIIVASGVAYFLLRDTISQNNLPQTFTPLENNYLDCIESYADEAVGITLSQGGYINLPEFSPGSSYMPFSSELYFAGISIPYWYYFTGNNIEVENVPTKSFMEEEIANYVKERISSCSFSDYYSEGYSVLKGNPDVEVTMNENDVLVEVNQGMTYSKGDEKTLINEHNVLVATKLGSLYDDSVEFYNQEKEASFIENYSVDVLRLYAPTDGIEITCSPKIWDAKQVFENISLALENNLIFLRDEGAREEYYNLDLGLGSNVRILNSKTWPKHYSVAPTESELLVARPVGNQQGLGILGFCYVPYHFVYDLRFPVLVQLTQNSETFQFPLAVIIDGNLAREGTKGEIYKNNLPDICEDNTNEVDVFVMDKDSNPLEARVSYECFSSVCSIGKTSNGELDGNFPQCANGRLLVEKEGYKPNSQTFSSIDGESVSVFLDKEYPQEINLVVDEFPSDKPAIITFESDEKTQTIMYPQTKFVNLSRGSYEVRVLMHENSSITFPETTREECVEVPSSFIGGIFGLTETQCSQIKVSEQEISNVLIGGGISSDYFSEEELASSKSITLRVKSLPTPKSIEELQRNYLLYESRGVEVEL